MGRKKKLKKVCCDPKVQQQNVAPSKLTIGEQNVNGIEEPRVDETSSQCNLKLDVVIVSNPSDEILPKTNQEFQPKSGRLDYFGI